MGDNSQQPNLVLPGYRGSNLMYVPSLQPPNSFDAYISGEVTVDPSAVIAPGVMLQASPDSQIIIGAGVCIGMGSIIHAHEGTLEVEAGAILGAGVLLVGKGKIGANACVGSTSTIWNASVAPRQVLSPGSLLGDESRQIVATTKGAIASQQTSVRAIAVDVTQTATSTNSMEAEIVADSTESASELPQTNTPIVYGQAHLNRMLSTMFPHRQALMRPLQNDPSSSDEDS